MTLSNQSLIMKSVVELDDAGIVHSYEVNYGDFVVKANLQKFKVIEKSNCK